MEIDDQGGEVVQRYKSFLSFRERLDMDMDKEGETLKNVRGSNILGQEKHTSRGSKLMNIDWLHLICAYSCACLYCMFLNMICMLMCCMLVIEFD
jgi:hypothetical protein